MFTSARIKLTGWYLLIIMLISASFSVAIYQVLTNELSRVERVQRNRQEHQLPEFRQRFPRALILDPQVIEETKERLKLILFFVNLGILGASSLAGYFLAGITLKPIKEMLEEQNRFVTDASHELRTPITALKSEIEVNLRDKKLPPTAKDVLASNLEEVNRLQSLSDNLIRMAQYQKSTGDFEVINLSDLLKEACSKVASLSRQQKITIENNVKSQKLLGNKQSLVTMFVILLDNAIKYSPKGKTITLNSKVKDRFVKVDIKDQGYGITQKDIPYLFDRFFRADKSRATSDIAGYGLGLSIAKQIVETHKGFVKVKSEIGKGSTFSIFLPI